MKIIPNFAPDEEARLRKTRDAFLAKMNALPEKHRVAYLNVTAHRAPGLGPDQADPYVQAMASQTLEGFKIQDRMKAARERLDEISRMDLKVYKPRDPQWAGKVLMEKQQLEESLDHDTVRFMGLREDTHERARREAVELYRLDAERQRKAAALTDAIARAEAAAEGSAVERRAAEIVASRRKANGQDAGE